LTALPNKEAWRFVRDGDFSSESELAKRSQYVLLFQKR
jgi:hypothetical protein